MVEATNLNLESLQTFLQTYPRISYCSDFLLTNKNETTNDKVDINN